MCNRFLFGIFLTLEWNFLCNLYLFSTFLTFLIEMSALISLAALNL